MFDTRLPRMEIINRDLKLLIMSVGCRRVVMGCLLVMRTLYLYIIGFDLLAIGLLSSIATITGAIRSLMVGVLADRYGKKIFLIMGGVFSATRLLIYAFFTDFAALALAQAIGAFGEGVGAGQPAVSGLIADKSTRKKRTRVFTTFALTNTAAAAIGSLLASTPKSLQTWLVVEETVSFQILFLVCALISTVSLVFLLPIREEHNIMKPSEKASLLPKRSKATISRFSLVRAVGGLGFGITGELIGPWFKIQFGMGEEVLGPIYATSRFLVLFLYFSLARIASAVGEVRSIALSRLVSAVATFIIPFVPGYQAVAFLLIVYRVSLMLTMPIRQSFITTIVDPSERASAIGISNLSRMSLRSLAPALGGYIMETLSLSLPFTIGAGIVALNGLGYYLFFGKAKRISQTREERYRKA